jgi:DNA-binding transcriptional regulator LsrR (DeoR family)
MREGLSSDVAMEDLSALGAVGDVLGVVIDAESQPIPHSINARVIGIGLDDLGQIPNMILATGGPHKVPVVRAVLKRSVVKTLVTDETTARTLLERT